MHKIIYIVFQTKTHKNSSSRFLGIIISEANCDGDLKRQMRKYYANAKMLLQKFSYCSPDVKCCMFKSYCATMCCSSMWFDSTVTSMKKLKIVYNNDLRRLLNLPKYNSASEMLVNLNIPSFNELLRKFVFSFKTRIIEYDNSLVNGTPNVYIPLVFVSIYVHTLGCLSSFFFILSLFL